MAENDRAYLRLANELADFARLVLKRRFRAGLPIDLKQDRTPVTPADREVEVFLRERIRRAFPDHGILGEEDGADRIDAELVWVLDPIDGTRSFIADEPLFGTLIALLRNGLPFLGVIESPITEERWVGLAGETLGPDRAGTVRVRDARPLAEATLCIAPVPSFPEELHGRVNRLVESVGRVEPHCDCYAYGRLAQGDFDLVIEADLSPYDYCALVPVVRGAGGVIHHWDGRTPGLAPDPTLVAATDRALADEALAVLRG